MYQLGGPGWLNSKFLALDLRIFLGCVLVYRVTISVEDQIKGLCNNYLEGEGGGGKFEGGHNGRF